MCDIGNNNISMCRCSKKPNPIGFGELEEQICPKTDKWAENPLKNAELKFETLCSLIIWHFVDLLKISAPNFSVRIGNPIDD